MRVSFTFTLFFLSSFLFSQQADTLESKGAIIIASLEGQVTVVNNTTLEPLPSSQVKAGGLLFDGHTVKTGPASKIILLLSNGTVSTIKSDSALNIKKFTQEKFDPKGKKLSEMKGEPSSSQTVMDLELGDMVFDVKKLDKRSSFNIESPVGTAGIRGTSGQMGVSNAAGATNLNINMFKGSVATQLRGSDISTLVRQGQSFSAGISASGIILPPTLGKVPTSILASIEADLEASEGATGVTSVGDSTVPAGEGGENIEDEAPSEEELQEQDAEQAAAAKGIDDNGSSEAVALDKAGLIDLNDPEKLDKVDTYVEATVNAAGKFTEKKNNEDAVSDPNGAQRYRRNSNGELEKNSGSFLADLVSNLDDVVDVTVEAEELGIDKAAMFDSLLENSENSGAVKEVVAVAAEVGIKDKDNLTSVFTSVDQADSVAKVAQAAKQVESEDAATLGAAFRSADQADKLVAVVEESNAQGDAGSKSKKLNSLFSVVKKVDAKKTARKEKMESISAGAVTLSASIMNEIDGFATVAELYTYLDSKITESNYQQIKDYADLRIDDLSITNSFDQISNVVKVVEVFEDIKAAGGTEVSDDVFDGILTNAEQAESLAEVVESGKKLGATKNLGAVLAKPERAADFKKVTEKVSTNDVDGAASLTLFENIEAVADVVAVAEKQGKSNDDLIKNVAKNANLANEMKTVVENLDNFDAGTNVDDVFTNIVDVADVVAEAGTTAANQDFIKNIAKNATKAKDVANVVKKAKKAGVQDTSLIQNLAANSDQAAELDAVFDKLGGENIDADAAKNILGNANEIAAISEAIGHAEKAGKTGADLTSFAKKDISEQKAVNEVVKDLGDNADAFLAQSFDDALQVKELLDDNVISSTDFTSAEGEGPVNFENVLKSSSLNTLNNRFANDTEILDIISVNESRAKDILFALNFVDAGSVQESALMGNIDKIDAIMSLSNKFRSIEPLPGESLTATQIDLNRENKNKLDIVFNNLDVVTSLDQLVVELAVFPEKLEVVFANADLAPSILNTYSDYEKLPNSTELISNLFSSSEGLRSTLSNDGLNNLISRFPEFTSEITKYSSKSAEINGLISLVGDKYANIVIQNLQSFDKLEALVLRTGQNSVKMEQLFSNVADVNRIFELSEKIKSLNVAGGQNALLSSIDVIFGDISDTGYYLFISDYPKFFVKLYDQSGDLSKVPSALAYELQALNLNRSDLSTVLSDLIEGPSSTGPIGNPPTGEGLSDEFAAVSILESHAFKGEIPKSLVLSEEQVRLSNLFKETLDVFDALDTLFYSPSTESASSSQSSPLGLLGGVNLTFTSGNYDLSNLGYDSLLIAASNNLSVSGSLAVPTTTILDELHFIAGGSLQIMEGSSITSSAISLGFGSFDSIEIVNVDLHAEGEIGVRSLDSIIISNSDFATRGTGADHIHLVAAADLAIDNLRFSEQVRQITMEAMTINLSNLNFPAGSSISLNSAYGGIDGVYPNFGSSAVGRVNFIENVKYSSHLLNSRSAFDMHGGAISIGIKSN
jgi:hypothetical protein